MIKKRKALTMALKALKQCNIYAFAGGLGVRAMEHTEAMEAIKEALAQPEQPNRQPLTDEEILKFGSAANISHDKTVCDVKFARAIEAAHGIKELNHD
jgi:hypothetical protein